MTTVDSVAARTKGSRSRGGGKFAEEMGDAQLKEVEDKEDMGERDGRKARRW